MEEDLDNNVIDSIRKIIANKEKIHLQSKEKDTEKKSNISDKLNSTNINTSNNNNNNISNNSKNSYSKNNPIQDYSRKDGSLLILSEDMIEDNVIKSSKSSKSINFNESNEEGNRFIGDDELISKQSEEMIEDMIDKLVSHLSYQSKIKKNMDESIEKFAKEKLSSFELEKIIKPLIKDWLNDNLKQIVESIIEKHISKIFDKHNNN